MERARDWVNVEVLANKKFWSPPTECKLERACAHARPDQLPVVVVRTGSGYWQTYVVMRAEDFETHFGPLPDLPQMKPPVSGAQNERADP